MISDNEQQANEYLQWMNRNYSQQKKKFSAYCHDSGLKWDEDVFSDTYMKIYDKILKDGIDDDSEAGFDNYTFMAFKMNIRREALYARNQKRDNNVTNIPAVYEDWIGRQLTEGEKLKSDLFKDFSLLFLMYQVEKNFDAEHFYLFRLKTFDKTMTYQKLQDFTGIKNCRQKVVEVKNWLKDNVKKEDIRKEFDSIYGEITQ